MKKISIPFWVSLNLMMLALAAPSGVKAQVRSAIDIQEWPAGTVVLVSGDSVSGPVTFHRTQEILNVHHPDGSITSLTPVNVAYFILKGMSGGYYYTFRSLPWDMGRSALGFKKPTFFEQLNSGPLTLLTRESYVAKSTNNWANPGNGGYYSPHYYYPESGSAWQEEVKELYYALLPDGEIVTLKNIRKDLRALFGEKAGEIKAFTKKNKLNYNQPADVIKIVNYFNSLYRTTNPAALK